jgi:signal transduction histidine kinase
MEGLLSKDLRDVRFSITDGDVLIYDEHVIEDTTFDPNPMFSERISLELYGRTWTVDVRSDQAFRKENTYAQPTLILIAGLIIESLIISLLFLMSQANKRSIAYATHVTAELRKKSSTLKTMNEELFCKNEELERFAYVTSHDLKTPIRGIGGLTEMVQEDLQDYFASPTANPEVSENLDRILDRVERMNQLTRGILEFSQTGMEVAENQPLVLGDVAEALRLDFELNPEQLKLTGDTESIQIDSFNFLRVLENLVGNAVKYHDDKENLEITISAQTAGDRCNVSVTDNGPGIDPRFHERIFDMFQTLRAGEAPESTGIGLAIVKKAVERHGGKMSLVSAPGTGASFRFDWPNKVETRSSINTNRAPEYEK